MAERDENATSLQPTLDVEKQPPTPVLEKLDIEHAIVQDDPRNWSSGRKVRWQRYIAMILLKINDSCRSGWYY